MKRLLLGLLSLLIAASGVSGNNSREAQEYSWKEAVPTPEEMAVIREIGEDRYARENIACIGYDKMLKSFSSDPLTDGSDYPDYYAGAFVDDDGDLVINVTDDRDSVLAALSENTGLAEVKTQKVRYSYRELISITHELQESVREAEPFVKDKVAGYGMDQEQGLVRVYIRETSNELEERILAMTDRPDAIIFVKSDGFTAEEKR